jgi:hypothetical protein
MLQLFVMCTVRGTRSDGPAWCQLRRLVPGRALA